MASHSLDVLGRLSLDVPDALARRVEAWDSTAAVRPALSASVIIVREAADGLETYLLHRHSRMPFAAEMVVFPGGRVDPEDHAAEIDPVRACALRETQEETSVQLGDHQLHPWAHWITPEVEPRRFDTTFFLAVMPAFQRAQDISGETDRALWTRPDEAIRAAERREIGLMPPTYSIMLELQAAGSVAALLALADGRTVEPVLPALERSGSRWQFRYPMRSD